MPSTACRRSTPSRLTGYWRGQMLTLIVAVATVAGDSAAGVDVPKGFFPVQDTGTIAAITTAPQSVSFAARSEKQQAVVNALMDDLAVRSVSSIIGVDGVNTTINNGRLRDRSATAGEWSSAPPR